MNRQALEQPFPQNVIKSRKGLSGKTFSYVEGAAYIKRLNDAFDGDWSFEVVEHQVQANEVIVLGKLTANGVVKSAFGGSSITVSKNTGEVISLADDLKSASTAALKKACSLLGVGLHLYSNDKPVAQANHTSNGYTNGERLTQKQLSAIWAMGRNLGLSSDDIRQRSIETFSAVPEQLNKHEASSFIKEFSEELNRNRGAA